MKTISIMATALLLAGCTSAAQKIETTLHPNARYVISAAKKHAVPVDYALNIAAIESGFNCRATSHAGALGIMQVMPATARKHGLNNAASLHDCTTGADIGMRELAFCLKLTGGNKQRAATCYNAGPGSLRWKRLPRETVNYIKKIK